MDLLSFARGPALYWSLAILIFGMLWRLTGILLQKRKPDFSEPRSTATWMGALKLIVIRSWPHKEFASRTAFTVTVSYLFHIGLAIIVFGFLPHIVFLKDVFGISWPSLPNSVIYFAGALTIGALIAVMVRRLVNPVLKLISNFDDYFSWFVTITPVFTGLLAAAHLGARYETLLAIHILSIELLFIWFPFGKLMHATLVFVSRGTTGALFARKGAQL